LAVLKRVAEDAPRPIREIIPETPQWLCDIIAKLHAKDPADRFPSARELADVLADCEAQLKTNGRIKDYSRIPQSKPPARGWSGRWRWIAIVALMLPVLAVAVMETAGVTRIFRGRRSTPTPKWHPPKEEKGLSAEFVEPPKLDPIADPPLATTPSGAANAARIAALPAAAQVEEVRKELMRRNPGFDGKVEHKIEDGVVTGLRINTDKVKDISPIRAFNALRTLDCAGSHSDDYRTGNGQLADLSPLKDMNLDRLTHLELAWTRVADSGTVYLKRCKELRFLGLASTLVSDRGLANFKDCKNLSMIGLDSTQVTDAGLHHLRDCPNLAELYLAGTQVTDAGLANFKGCTNLERLNLTGTPTGDVGLANFQGCTKLTVLWLMYSNAGNAGLAHFKDCKNLAILHIEGTRITDLSPLEGLPIKELSCDLKLDRDSAILRSIKTLETINGKPAAEVWKELDEK
jgi:hypothetical protein